MANDRYLLVLGCILLGIGAVAFTQSPCFGAVQCPLCGSDGEDPLLGGLISRRPGNASIFRDVAICISGQPRGAMYQVGHRSDMHHDYDPTITLPEHTRRWLYPSLGVVDVFMLVNTRRGVNESQFGDTRVCEGFRPPPPGQLSCQLLDEDKHPLNRGDYLNDEGWETYSSSPDSYLRDVDSLRRCAEMIRQKERNLGFEYEYFIRWRPDLVLRSTFPPLHSLSSMLQSPRTMLDTLFVPADFWSVDSFSLGSRTIMDRYMDRMHLLNETWQREFHTFKAEETQWRAEDMMNEIMRSIDVKLFAMPVLFDVLHLQPGVNRPPSYAGKGAQGLP